MSVSRCGKGCKAARAMMSRTCWWPNTNGEPVGTGTIFPAQMWLSGVPMDVGAVGWRNGGYHASGARHRRQIDEKSHRQYVRRRDGRCRYFFPFSHHYYQQFNYGYHRRFTRLPFYTGNIAVSGNLEHVRPFLPEDLPMMRRCTKAK